MNDHEFIKKFLKIKLNYICKEYNYNISNIMNGTASKDKIRNCRVLIEESLTKLLDESRGNKDDFSNNND